MLDTLGEVVTCALAIVAVLIVPAAIARAWWPEVKRAIHNTSSLFVDTFFMSSAEDATPRAADTNAVHVPVLSTDTGSSTRPEPRDITDDMTPIGLTTKPTRREIIITLAMLRSSDNKHLFSANAIYELVKGPRAEVLNLIREAREGPAPAVYREYPPQLTPANGHED